jgi:N-acyl-D-aspartate/D-glutamate deacylase
MTLDLKISGATIVDGSGEAAFAGDVGIKEGLIVEVGRVDTPAARTISADGALLTPGFIDPHTHYDGQAMWDEELLSSSLHGVTTAVFGNCGVGFAPLQPGRQDDLVTLMAGVEDVPGSVLHEGLDWRWRGFGDYLDRLSERRWTIDLAAQITHDPVRIFVMGERGLRREPATTDDIAAMRDIVSEALGAGAIGFSTGRNDAHRMADGRDTPASLASKRELVAIAEAFRDHGQRVLQLTSDFDMAQGHHAFDDEFALIEDMARTSGRAVSLNLVQRPSDNDQWRRVMERASRLSAEGADLSFQVSPRGIGVLMGLNSSFHPFVAHPTFKTLAGLPLAELVGEMRRPAVRARLLAEKPDPFAGKDNAAPQFFEDMLQGLEDYSARIFPDRSPRDYEPPYEDSLQAEARRRGVSAVEAVYDALLDRDGASLLYWPIVNYGSGNFDNVREMLVQPNVMLGLGDAGAHVNNTTDYSYSTFALAHWPRRRGGAGLRLERVVELMTGIPARHFGMTDRGQIRPGLRADINLIDRDRLGLKDIRVLRDLPAGGQRLLQEAQGYLATFQGGVQTLENDRLTGARPGRLLRAA